jgi:glycosyltransferase involved in cell wall biosynthesis
MRIALISTWGAPCGISVYSSDVFRELARRGHTVHVLAADESMPVEAPAEITYTRAWRLGHAPSWRLALELVRCRPDVIHVQHEIGFFSPTPNWREWLDCLNSVGVPVVVTYHSVPDAATSITDLPVAAAIVCSPIGAGLLESRVNFPVAAVEHAVDGAIPTERTVEPHSLVTFGFLSECKGYERILSAMAELRTAVPDLTLTILGSLTPRALSGQIEYFQRLHQRIAALGLTGRVDVSCGFRTPAEVRAVLSRKAIGVLHYDRTDRLTVSGMGEIAEVPCELALAGTTGPWLETAAQASLELVGTTGSFPTDPGGTTGVIEKGRADGHVVKAGRAGIRCQSAAVFRMWSAGVPCIVSQAQHFDLGPKLRPALIRADSCRSLTDHIHRLCTRPDDYQTACGAVSRHVTRQWTDVADDHERVYAAVLGRA